MGLVLFGVVKGCCCIELHEERVVVVWCWGVVCRVGLHEDVLKVVDGDLCG